LDFLFDEIILDAAKVLPSSGEKTNNPENSEPFRGGKRIGYRTSSIKDAYRIWHLKNVLE